MNIQRPTLKTIFSASVTMLAAVLYLIPISCQSPVSEQPPNVLLIMTDDQGWGDIQSHGNNLIDTPVQDKLASQGARFERFFVSPVCAPTRASLLTGRYHLRTGTSWVTRGLETMRSDETTVAEILKDAGYATGCFGKWHNGAHFPEHPNGQGFEDFFGFCAGHWNNYFNTRLQRNGVSATTTGYITDVLTDAALEFIEQNQDRPFFCYIPFNAPHGPFQVPDKYFDKYKARGLNNKDAAVYGMVENIDDNLARLLNKLDELNLANDTIVMFLTDNGPNGKRYNGGMKGTKGSVHEGGIRVPLFVRWPGPIPESLEITDPAGHIDLLPTILELTGVRMPAELAVDGRSLKPLLTGELDSLPERNFFTHQNRGVDLQRYPGSVRTARYRCVRYGDNWELYDMIVDPGQLTDISSQNRTLTDSLSRAYDYWFDDVSAGYQGRPWISVGYPQASEVRLPAPEAFFGEEVRFYGDRGWANDWLVCPGKQQNRIWWQLAVVTAGEYSVSLKYNGQSGIAGTEIQVQCGQSQSKSIISEAFMPAFYPSPDRIDRGEVYEKDWAVLDLGTLKLESGKQKLELRTGIQSPNSVLEIKSLVIRKL